MEVAVVHHEQLGRQFEVDRVLPRAAAPLHHPLPMVPHLRVGNATSATSAGSQVRTVPPIGRGAAGRRVMSAQLTRLPKKRPPQ